MADVQKEETAQEAPEAVELTPEEIRAAERNIDQSLDFGMRANAFAAESANATIRALILINGGAAIAVLTFVGSVFSGSGLSNLAALTLPVIWFAWGVALAVLCAGLAYLANLSSAAHSFRSERYYTWPNVVETSNAIRWGLFGTFCQVSAALVACGSLGCFLLGVYSIREAVLRLA